MGEPALAHRITRDGRDYVYDPACRLVGPLGPVFKAKGKPSIVSARVTQAAPEDDLDGFRVVMRQQEKFLSLMVREALYGGAKGGAKSYALLLDVAARIHHPDFFGILFRRESKQLADLVRVSKRIFPHFGGRFNHSEKTWTFPSGAILRMAHMKHPTDYEKYQGHNYTWVGFDELGNFTKEQYEEMKSCARSSSDIPVAIRATCNPGGPLHHYIKKRFIDPSPPEMILVELDDEGTRLERIFIPALLSDNPYLANDKEYRATLARMSERKRRAYLFGDWDILAGDFFDDFDRAHHVLSWKDFRSIYGIRPGQFIPKEWVVGRAYDHGYREPFACLWFAYDPEGRMIIFQEWYGCRDGEVNVGVQKNASEIAKGIKERDWPGLKVVTAVADTQIKQNHGHGKTIEELFLDEGLSWKGATKARETGWAFCHERMRLQEAGKAQDGEKSRPGVVVQRGKRYMPGVYVIDTCREFLRTVPVLTAHPKKLNDISDGQEDHLADAWRYACMEREWRYQPEYDPSMEGDTTWMAS